MRSIRIALLLAVLAFGMTLAYAQEPGDEHRPPNHQDEARPAENREAPPARQEEARPPRQQQQEEAKPPRETRPERQETAKPPREQSRPAHAEKGEARPAGKSARIPDPKFKASFGRQHAFTVNRVINTTTVVPNQTQFVLAGYTFVFLDPWPAEWLFTDDCYIEFVDDEYFLFDTFHPGLRVALFVVG
ncbi:MAG TPA: hypothetical protein VFO39_06655 [Candidatus Sulfotelmatobacter sp.]|nr:hypothetical protein [Candidatus Sulfotelmatobacter sp.]